MTLTHEFLLVKPEKNILNMANHLNIYIYTHVLVKSHVWDFQQTDSHQHVAGRLTHIYIYVYMYNYIYIYFYCTSVIPKGIPK